jgi:hypothetical protein
MLVTVALAACGSSDPAPSKTSAGKRYVDALLAGYEASNAKSVFTRAQAECISNHAVDAVGVQALKDSGVTPKEIAGKGSFQLLGSKLSKADGRKLGDVFVSGECFQLADALINAGVSSGFKGIPKAKVRCIMVEMAKPTAARAAFANSVLGRPGADAAMKQAFGNPAKVLDAVTVCKVDPKLFK